MASYKGFRLKFLKKTSWGFVSRLGAGAFSQITGEVVKAILISVNKNTPTSQSEFLAIDTSISKLVSEKASRLLTDDFKMIKQLDQIDNPDAKIILEESNDISEEVDLLKKVGNSFQGIKTGDDPRFKFCFWECCILENWRLTYGGPFTGCNDGAHYILNWSHSGSDFARYQGSKAFNKVGLYITNVGRIQVSNFISRPFTSEITVFIPNELTHLTSILSFLSSSDYEYELKKIDQNLAISTASVGNVPFDLEYWEQVAKNKYPTGIPQPYSDDAIQWIYHGNPTLASNPLQVAMSRLLGYRWPAESDTEMELAEEAREHIGAIRQFNSHTDDDGIMCLPAINGELQAAERCREYLMAVWGEEWSNNTLQKLLQKEGANKTNLDEWLRDEFMDQHNKLFQNRPFIWQIWDGRKDGFSALVNYHKLNKENLSKLIYTYLGDWIRMCEAKVKAGESGAEGLRSAALKLKEKLEAILKGEAPYDIFVRWKPLDQQPIGWEPDLNDGVRLNIRPFILADVLRKKPNIKWGVDRGKNPPGTPWGTERDNDMHLSLEEK